MTPRRVVLIRSVESELAVEVEADTDAEAERLALEVCPDSSRAWTVVNHQVSASVEESCPR